jgi:adenylate cyclase
MRQTPKTDRRRKLLREYRDHLMVALLISLGIFPFLLRSGLWPALALSSFATLVFGTCFFLLSLVRNRIRLPLFSLNLIIQTLLIAATVFIGALLTAWAGLAVAAHRSPLDGELVRTGAGLLTTRVTPIALAGGIALAGMVNAYFAVDRKMGPGVLRNWMTGKYYNPKEEERIFMFLDLRNSTTLAEQLGNVRFSALVRDFFRDLTDPVLESKGDVSHYIGDEAVISWTPKQGIRDSNCVLLFFRMREALAARAGYYTQRYGLVPEFKAGLHIGPVIATEVGEVKSEIVFHGDVVNTAARIQSLCAEEGCPLLLSADLAARLQVPPPYAARSLGARRLKGKTNDLQIVAIDGP